jgi:hypothetical protein
VLVSVVVVVVVVIVMVVVVAMVRWMDGLPAEECRGAPWMRT